MNEINVIMKDQVNKNINFIYLYINSIDQVNNIDIEILSDKKNQIISFLKNNNFHPNEESIQYISLFLEEKQYYVGIIGFDRNKQRENYESIKNNIGNALDFAQSKKAAAIIFYIDNILENNLLNAKLIGKLFQSTLLIKLYHFNEYISNIKKHIHSIIDVNICLYNKDFLSQLKAGIEEGIIIGNAINFSRKLSDTPSKDLYPESFIKVVEGEIKAKNITCEKIVFDTAELEKNNMGGILGVGQGSIHKPKLLILKYTPQDLNNSTLKIALVGKGVTFDTGGVSIKSSGGMEEMKTDMSGAAAVVSAFIGLVELKSPYVIYAVTPLAENMVDGNSIKPGDILRFYNGKTAEVKNTDAEGRLVLADALSYVSDIYKPDVIIDLATLTGACRIALGPVYAGLMSENIELRNTIEKVGNITGDKCWPLPLEQAYEPNMHSHVADICNIGTKGYKAGATMGGMFLREFVSKDIAWAHIDIAPVACDCPFKKYLLTYGATGFGVNLLIELLASKEYLK